MHPGSQGMSVWIWEDKAKTAIVSVDVLSYVVVPLDFGSLTWQLCNVHINANSFFSAFPLLWCGSAETIKITLCGYMQ